MNRRGLHASVAVLVLCNAGLGQSISADPLSLFSFGKKPLVVLQRDKKSGIAMIVIGALLIAAYKAPVGHGAGGGGFGEGDPTPVFLGGGLIVLGADQMPHPPSWMPSISFVRRKPTIHWTVSQW